jgi:hypothetical protein
MDEDSTETTRFRRCDAGPNLKDKSRIGNKRLIHWLGRLGSSILFLWDGSMSLDRESTTKRVTLVCVSEREQMYKAREVGESDRDRDGGEGGAQRPRPRVLPREAREAISSI